MANLPRFGRPRQRLSAVAPPVPAAAQPTADPFATAIQTLQPLEPTTTPAPASPLRESPRRSPLPSPPKKATSPFASPKYGASLTRVDSPKAKRSPQYSPRDKYLERRSGETTPPRSPDKSRRAKTPPLSPLALPRSQVISGNGTMGQPRIRPEVETKGIVYNKDIEKPAKYDRPLEYSSGKPHQRRQQQAEVINLNGHNVGAVMEVNKSSAGYRLGREPVKMNETEGEGEDGGRHGDENKKKETKKKPPMTAFMNTNFQSVNNSVLYESSCSHRDPGLHLGFSDAADVDGDTVDGHKSYKPKPQ